ncbi:hypothetical protein [Dryocola clanedunensis]
MLDIKSPGDMMKKPSAARPGKGLNRYIADKKRPNTIPIFGPGKWLLGESRALKVGINAGLVALPIKNRLPPQVFQSGPEVFGKKPFVR